MQVGRQDSNVHLAQDFRGWCETQEGRLECKSVVKHWSEFTTWTASTQANSESVILNWMGFFLNVSQDSSWLTFRKNPFCQEPHWLHYNPLCFQVYWIQRLFLKERWTLVPEISFDQGRNSVKMEQLKSRTAQMSALFYILTLPLP